jgi:hypothetical protein
VSVEADGGIKKDTVDVHAGAVCSAERGIGAKREVRGAAGLLVDDADAGQGGAGVDADAEFGERAAAVASGVQCLQQPFGRLACGVGVWPGNEADDLVFRRETAVPWSYGEEGWDEADAEVRT